MIRTLSAALATTTCLVAVATPAAAQTREFNIPAGSLSAALDMFARQSGRQVIYRGDEVRTVRSAGVRGALTAEEALNTILASTGFKTQRDSSGAFAVAKVGNAKSADDSPVASSGASDRDGNDIVVTGTRLRGVSDIPAPTQTINRQTIEAAGYTRTEQVFRDLPQNLNEFTTGAALGSGNSDVSRANGENAQGIDLRGLGAGSTLVLLNGRRLPGLVQGRVADVSAFPLGAIEKVDVVTGGSSAIYGSDAVAGVVNIVTRRDFAGAESSLSYGIGKNGGNKVDVGQVLGLSGSRAGIMVAYDYQHDDPLNVVDTGVTVPTDDGLVLHKSYIIRPQDRHSIIASGHFNLTDSIELYADGTFSDDRNTDVLDYSDAFSRTLQETRYHTREYNIDAGVRFDLSDAWKLDLSGQYGRDRSDISGDFYSYDETGALSFSQIDSLEKSYSSVWELSGNATGTIHVINMDVKAAFSGSYRRENICDAATTFGEVCAPGMAFSFGGRSIWSVAGELAAPLIKDGPPGLKRLEVTAAGRYDHYSDFGGTFNPQFGIVFEPTSDIKLKAAYSRAFRAPYLFDTGTAALVQISSVIDPLSASGKSPVLVANGGNPNLGPEKADTFTATVEIHPSAAPGLGISFSYFDINYRGRIGAPASSSEVPIVLRNRNIYSPILTESPTQAQVLAVAESDTDGFILNRTGLPWDGNVQHLLSAFPNLIILDNRSQNISKEFMNGLDFNANWTLRAGGSVLTLGANGTLIFKYKRTVFSGAPSLSRLNVVGAPVDLRVRGNLGWERGPLLISAFLNYTPSYQDNISVPAGRIGSWTTFDLNARLSGKRVFANTALSGLDLNVSVSNLFDKKPPFFGGNSSFALGYDPVNSNAIGRYVTIGARYRW